jgi:hypothetical protein
MAASFNLGVWRHALLEHGAVYRWEGDQGRSGSGFVVLDADRETVRPSDAEGRVIGDLVADCRSVEISGSADGIDRAAFTQVVAALLRARAKSGATPETAHAYYG